MKLFYKADRLLSKAMFDDYGNINPMFRNIYLLAWMFSALLAGIVFGRYVEPPSSVIVHCFVAMGVLFVMFVVGFVVPLTALQLVENSVRNQYAPLQWDRVREQERERQQEIQRRFPVTIDDK